MSGRNSSKGFSQRLLMRPELCRAAGTPGIFGRSLLGSYDRYLQIFECANMISKLPCRGLPGTFCGVTVCQRGMFKRTIRTSRSSMLIRTEISFCQACSCKACLLRRAFVRSQPRLSFSCSPGQVRCGVLWAFLSGHEDMQMSRATMSPTLNCV